MRRTATFGLGFVLLIRFFSTVAELASCAVSLMALAVGQFSVFTIFMPLSSLSCRGEELVYFGFLLFFCLWGTVEIWVSVGCAIYFHCKSLFLIGTYGNIQNS